jgi:hypothetical protein
VLLARPPIAELRAGVTTQASADLNADALVRSAADCAVLNPGEALVRSAKDLLEPSGEVDLAACRSVAARDDTDDAIDKLTEELAAFCFDRLEKSVMLSNSGDLDMNADAFEDELQV